MDVVAITSALYIIVAADNKKVVSIYKAGPSSILLQPKASYPDKFCVIVENKHPDGSVKVEAGPVDLVEDRSDIDIRPFDFRSFVLEKGKWSVRLSCPD